MWPIHTLLVQGVLCTDLLAHEPSQLERDVLPLTLLRDTMKHLLFVLNDGVHQQPRQGRLPIPGSLPGRLPGRLAPLVYLPSSGRTQCVPRPL
jgi:hypothetical protein